MRTIKVKGSTVEEENGSYGVEIEITSLTRDEALALGEALKLAVGEILKLVLSNRTTQSVEGVLQ